MRINREIRASSLRVIGPDGEQVGILSLQQARALAEDHGLDLVEIAPNAQPPVCKIIDYGKFRYDQTKREKESKKAQHQVKVKEVKVRPNINDHDLEVKVKRARGFFEKGCKVKVTCMLRGREMAHPERGTEIVKKVCASLEDIATPESPVKRMGRSMIVVLAPGAVKKKQTKESSQPEEIGNA